MRVAHPRHDSGVRRAEGANDERDVHEGLVVHENQCPGASLDVGDFGVPSPPDESSASQHCAREQLLPPGEDTVPPGREYPYGSDNERALDHLSKEEGRSRCGDREDPADFQSDLQIRCGWAVAILASSNAPASIEG